MRRLALACLVLLVPLLAACGDEGTTTIVETTVVETAPTTPAEPATDAGESPEPTAADGPSGELGVGSVGAVSQGMGTDEVEAAFGPPQRTNTYPGCPLDPNAKPELAWRWELGDGYFQLNFDARSRTLSSYRTNSAEFATEMGDRVGDSIATVRGHWGSRLKPFDLGAESTSYAGLWVVGDTATSALLFDARGGTVRSISGGYLPACE